jgi:5'(3')-deoxyribonucleotidase
MKIGIDIDNVVYNTSEAVLSVHYEDTGERLTLSDIKSYDMSKYVSPQYQKDFYKIFGDKRVWDRVELLPDCVDSIRQLYEAGHEIYFVTATSPENISYTIIG